jgi:heptosyltransferase II
MEAPGTRSPAQRRLLVRGVNWLGDAVMTTPALLRLREAQPQANITLLTHEKLADLWRHHPAIDRTMTFQSGEGVWSISRRLRGERFDTALLFPNSLRSALEARLAGIPRRIGGAWPWRNWLLAEVVPAAAGAARMRKRTKAEVDRRVAAGSPRAVYVPDAHQIHHYLRLAAALGASAEPMAPRLEVTPVEIEGARQRFGLSPDIRWLGINAGAEYGPAKRWPTDRFMAVACEAMAWPGWGVILLGGPAEVPIARGIEEGLRRTSQSWPAPVALTSLAGRTSLRELCATLKCCDVVVTNDSGPMHVAAAVGTPTVALFGSTSPELTGPGLPGDPRHRLLKVEVPCAPCFLRECPIDFRCMSSISVVRVVEAMMEAWRHASPR